jgi:hypothetical protein
MMGTDRADFLQPVLRRVLFWDVPLDHIDLDRHADWLIARVLWRGTLDDVRRVAAVFGPERVRAVAATHRGLPDGFRPFWIEVFTEEVNPVHPETLAPNTRAVLDQHGHALCPDRFLLCGGTAVALYLGHRRSVDLDFFTADPFDAATLADTLTRTVPGYTVDVVSPGTVHGRVQDVEVSHIHQIGVSLPADGVYAGVPLASLPALCAMKCNALSTPGERKDFIDVYALALAAGGITPVLRHAFTHAPGLNRVHVLRSLTFFTDADASPMPEMLVPWDWATVRDAFTRFAHAETRRTLDLPGPHL